MGPIESGESKSMYTTTERHHQGPKAQRQMMLLCLLLGLPLIYEQGQLLGDGRVLLGLVVGYTPPPLPAASAVAPPCTK